MSVTLIVFILDSAGLDSGKKKFCKTRSLSLGSDFQMVSK